MDLDAFLTTRYVMIDDFCQSTGFAQKHRPGPAASLSCSEVVTLAVFGQWARVPHERAFYRCVLAHLHTAFPTPPQRELFNRLQRSYRDATVTFGQFLVEQMQAQDRSGIPTRGARRRGTGWLAGQADIGWCTRPGWYEGLHLLCAINSRGVITGFGFAAAGTHDQPLADTCFAAWAQPTAALLNVGSKAQGISLADQGFAGEEPQTPWRERNGAEVSTAPHQRSQKTWSKAWRCWLAGLKQVVETIYDKRLNTLRLARERPHWLSYPSGGQRRLA
ncbi:MAG TPA: hypothetical protein VGF67_14675 [Ktedonobacteraceae bacterium]|jgi:hypothetical protein